MNADDRSPASDGQPSATPASAQQPVRRAGMMPPSGSVPQRTAFRPVTGTHPAGQQPPAPATRPASFSPAGPSTSASRPFSSAAPAAPTTVPPVAAPTTSPASPRAAEPTADAPRSVTASAGIGRLKDAAKEAKDRMSQATAKGVEPAVAGAPRKVRVMLSRIDPWSALKIGFLLAIAAGIMMVVAVHVLWNTLNSMNTLVTIQEWVSKLFGADQEVNILQFIDYNKVMSATLLVSVTNVVLISGLSVIAAFLYNTVSRVVGGVYLTLTDD